MCHWCISLRSSTPTSVMFGRAGGPKCRDGRHRNWILNLIKKQTYNNSGVRDNSALLTLTGTNSNIQEHLAYATKTEQKTRTKIQTDLIREWGTGETQREQLGWGTHTMGRTGLTNPIRDRWVGGKEGKVEGMQSTCDLNAIYKMCMQHYSWAFCH